MVSLKDLPYEFVFLRKPPSEAAPPAIPALSSLSTERHSRLPHSIPQSRTITREQKPQTSIAYCKARVQLVRRLRFKVRQAVRYRSYKHHEHSCHKNFSLDWRKEYSKRLGKYMPDTKVYQSKRDFRNKLLTTLQNGVANKCLTTYLRKTEEREKRRKERQKMYKRR